MKLTINGDEYDIAESPPRPLLWVLRDELGLTGTKFGCGAGFCGACTVHINGEAVRSCVTPLTTINGEVRTIEGLPTVADDGMITLHPVQQAFLEDQVPQCSWCMSGQIMTAAAFLAKNPIPNENEIVEAMGENYCRCGCYFRIKGAVAKAAEQLATQEETAV
ncbi:(2Fe-2S)-binding protein [Candidatus Leptofilum sp.]|uniref:(2Fe-2S)-binding protein n=1 Tax=Candidatus Leptofilum sp. TaxID=3241576 RepID=UPI003B5BF949